eukprot:4345390-Lingulodinium_polyedra.AAC.1
MRTHSAAVQAAKVKVADLAALSVFLPQTANRCPQHHRCSLVIKWKWVEEAGKKERVIRARLTVRRFKDLDKDKLATYVGAASRRGQRLI